MKLILCFGDSLTYGFLPSSDGSWGRYGQEVRWTGILQKKLGQGFTVIEEGLPGRTINLDDPREDRKGRNGSTYLKPCLESHAPLDAVVMFLGTNDCKDYFNQSVAQIVESMEEMIETMKDTLDSRLSSDVKIILVAPPKINVSKKICSQYYAKGFAKIEKLAAEYKEIAEKRSLGFVDLFSSLEMPQTADGIHLDEEANQKISELIYQQLILVLE